MSRVNKIRRRRSSLRADAKLFNQAFDEVFAKKRPELKWQRGEFRSGFGKKTEDFQ